MSLSKKFFLLFAILGVLNLTGCGTSDDPCDEVDCVNGNCYDGTCECISSYTGEVCDVEKQPSKITIKKVKILAFPTNKSNGSAWDKGEDQDGEEPDVYLRIYDLRNVYYDLKNVPTQVKLDAKIEDGIIEYEPNIRITSFENPIKFELNDYDVDNSFNPNSEFMISISVDFNTKWKGFPEVLTIENSSGSFKIECDLSYTW